MKREDGFYWVRQDNSWKVAEWDNGFWYLPGLELTFIDEDMSQIIEVKLTQEIK